MKILLIVKNDISVVLSVAKQEGNMLNLNLGKSYNDIVKTK